MDARLGRLVYLPAGVAAPDPDALLSYVLTGASGEEFCASCARRHPR